MAIVASVVCGHLSCLFALQWIRSNPPKEILMCWRNGPVLWRVDPSSVDRCR